ncbi:MAG TPA: AMP-binding protein, partial [Acidimicrobiales bacterium]|nr:AMP-binding protein [Acidimicrobiales bacterium]
MIDLIRRASTQTPDAPAVISRAGSLTYAQLAARAEALARGLQARSLTRVACVITDPVTLLAVLAATSAVGCEACTYAPQLPDAGIDELAAAFGHTVVVTDRDLHLAVAEPLLVSELPTEEGELPAPGAAPLMVLTTGTTARPKAARYD